MYGKNYIKILNYNIKHRTPAEHGKKKKKELQEMTSRDDSSAETNAKGQPYKA